MSVPRITPCPPRVIRIEDRPDQFVRYGDARIARFYYDDGTVFLFFGPYRVRSIRHSEKWSMPNNPYTILILDDGAEIHLGRISSLENHWLTESISLRRPPQ